MSLNSEVLCAEHKHKADSICCIKSCSERFLCEACLQTQHAIDHSSSICKLNEFLFNQNKRRIDIVKGLEGELSKIHKDLMEYELFVDKANKAIDRDFEAVLVNFQNIATTAKLYLKNSVNQDCVVHKQKLAEIIQSLSALKTYIMKKDDNDFIVNYQTEPLGESIEKLIDKNTDMNKKHSEIKNLQKNLDYGFNNRVFYKINENANALYDEMCKVLTTLSLRFFKKFKLLLVRPKFESAFNEQFELLKQKLNQELSPKNTTVSENFSSEKMINIKDDNSMSNDSGFFRLKKDLDAVNETIFIIPDYVNTMIQNFGEFKPPKDVVHPSFTNLVKKPCVKLEDDSIYEGEWSSEGVRTGRGRCIYPDGVFYDGYWIDGEPQILGRYIRKSGDLYEGLIKDGKADGKGVLVDVRGYRYVGYWKQDMRHGLGDELFPSKGTYKGGFLFDKHHGKGVLRLPNESSYDGEFFEGRFNGYGIFKWHTGEIYEGEWNDDKKHGKGKYVYEDGRIYEGDFVSDVPHGFGKLIQKDGKTIESFWKDGKPSGIGLRVENNDKEAIVWDSHEVKGDSEISLIDG